MKVRVAPFQGAKMEDKRLNLTKRFGARYGRSLKERLAKIEVEYRGKNKCPYCGKIKVKRLAVGIWFCHACKAKFTGKAYSITKKIITRGELEAPEEVKKAEEPETSEEEA
jgi:large subunit ribosomal protein L37Ae